MRALTNSVRLLGNLGNDPEVKEYGSKKMARFSLATTDYYVNQQGEKVKETQWHNIVVWGKPAEKVEKGYFKGCQIILEGKLVSRSYNDKNGQTKYTTEVVANDLLLVKQPG